MVKGVGRGGGESCNIKEKDFNNELSLNGSKYINQIDHVCHVFHVFQVFCVVSCCFVLFRVVSRYMFNVAHYFSCCFVLFRVVLCCFVLFCVVSCCFTLHVQCGTLLFE